MNDRPNMKPRTPSLLGIAALMVKADPLRHLERVAENQQVIRQRRLQDLLQQCATELRQVGLWLREHHDAQASQLPLALDGKPDPELRQATDAAIAERVEALAGHPAVQEPGR